MSESREIKKKKETKQKKFNLYEFHSNFADNIQLSYKGPFTNNILATLGNYIKYVFAENPKASKKLFGIFIELCQNISFYSAEKNHFYQQNNNSNSGIGTLVIAEYDDYYALSTGNIVKNIDVIPIIEKCELINSLDRQGLRKYKREQRNLPPGERGGAHIGLIQIALTSANPLDFEVTIIDDEYSFFAITVKVEK